MSPTAHRKCAHTEPKTRPQEKERNMTEHEIRELISVMRLTLTFSGEPDDEWGKGQTAATEHWISRLLEHLPDPTLEDYGLRFGDKVYGPGFNDGVVISTKINSEGTVRVAVTNEDREDDVQINLVHPAYLAKTDN